MKNIFYFFLATIFAGSCKIDNYASPNAMLSGKLIDNETNEAIENGGVNGGAVIQMYDGSSTQPILTNSYPDGHFVNNALFSGNYKIVAVGAFKMAGDTIRTAITGNTAVDIKVLPNVRLKATLQERSGTTATVKVEYSKLFDPQTLNQLAVVWSTIDNPNIFSSFEGGQKMEDVSAQGLTSGEKIFTITGLKEGVKYYIRAAGLTSAPGNYYNYSTTIKP
ncbi:MAG: DUF3823 domain-containing protein [Agriterribacter sp.]